MNAAGRTAWALPLDPVDIKVFPMIVSPARGRKTNRVRRPGAAVPTTPSPSRSRRVARRAREDRVRRSDRGVRVSNRPPRIRDVVLRAMPLTEVHEGGVNVGWLAGSSISSGSLAAIHLVSPTMSSWLRLQGTRRHLTPGRSRARSAAAREVSRSVRAEYLGETVSGLGYSLSCRSRHPHRRRPHARGSGLGVAALLRILPTVRLQLAGLAPSRGTTCPGSSCSRRLGDVPHRQRRGDSSHHRGVGADGRWCSATCSRARSPTRSTAFRVHRSSSRGDLVAPAP